MTCFFCGLAVTWSFLAGANYDLPVGKRMSRFLGAGSVVIPSCVIIDKGRLR